MRDHRPIVRALLMTTAAAWSIGTRCVDDAREQLPVQWSGRADARPQPAPVVLPFRRIPGAAAGAASTTEKRGAA
ncbi:MAG: hypothetical protein LT103_14530 [Burkholderiaceae bacterium]|nr:hypothetical protein [Burkholderiaceae bacterium]